MEAVIIKGEDDLERLQADGEITPEDADEIRTFAAFLTDVQAHGVGHAYRTHYPEQYARDTAAYAARVAAQQDTPSCDACGDTGRVPWMVEADPHGYQERDADGTVPCPDCTPRSS